MSDLVAPFPYFGGKRAAVDIVWPRFGRVDNYVEPFCGSLAMLLGAPAHKRVETVNDFSGFIVNFWRAVKHDPEATAKWADWPVTEKDLEARHGWLVNRAERLKWSLEDPDFYDPKIAGWWVWGANAWIGSGWCLGDGPWLSNGAGINRKLPHVGDAGQGINRQLPHVGDAGRGINASTGVPRFDFILGWFEELCGRLRDVRITCGDWSRVTTPVCTVRNGATAVFLDPPYLSKDISGGLYSSETGMHDAIKDWCVENGQHQDMRIALCGYDGEYDLQGWTVTDGRATNGGYGNQAGNDNAKRERIWFSPHCVNSQPDLFG